MLACARDQPTDTRWTPLPTGLLDALFTRGGVASPHRSKPKRETHVGRTDRGGNGEAPRGRSGQLSRCFVLLQRLPEFPPSERGCRRLRVQRRRGWELEEQGLGVEVGASLTMNVDACRLTAILGGATTVIRARLWPGACLGLRAGAPVFFLHSRDFLIARSWSERIRTWRASCCRHCTERRKRDVTRSLGPVPCAAAPG